MNILKYIIAAAFIYIYIQTSSWIALGIGFIFCLGAIVSSLTGSNDSKNTDTNKFQSNPKSLSEAEKIKTIAAARKVELEKPSSHPPLLAVHLGGTGTDIPIGETIYLGTSNEEFLIFSAIKRDFRKILLSDLMSVEISGPGTQTTNAGLIGGGFGLEGAAKGMLAAALINAATTKKTTDTFLRVATNKSEALFHFNDQEPSALRLTLSQLFVAADANKSYNAAIPISISDELIKLQSLKEAGVLSEAEFSNAKQKLLA